jgi:uncharacterized paraquat-inducible protein A
LARSVPLSRFTPRVGGGSAFFVRRFCASRVTKTKKHLPMNANPHTESQQTGYQCSVCCYRFSRSGQNAPSACPSCGSSGNYATPAHTRPQWAIIIPCALIPITGILYIIVMSVAEFRASRPITSPQPMTHTTSTNLPK